MRWLLGSAALGLLLGAVLYGGPHLVKLRARADLRRRCRTRGALVLSYDDGPSEAVTPRLLEILERAQAKATFFAQGTAAGAFPALLDRIGREGHEVGCHSQWHRNAWTVGPFSALADARAGLRTLEPWLASSRFYRPPNGKIDALTWWLLRAQGARIAWWTHDSGDTAALLPEPADVARAIAAEGGGVVLMHDSARSARRCEFVVELTQRLLDAAREAELRVIPLGALLEPETART